MRKTEERWSGILALVEESLEDVGLDEGAWEAIKETVSTYEARESGPLFESFRERFLRKGIDPVKADEMARLACQPRHRY